MFNTTAKALGISFLGLAFCFFVYSWKHTSVENFMVWLQLANIGLWSMSLSVTLLITKRLLAWNPRGLKLSNAVWQDSADEFPKLFRCLGWFFKFLRSCCLVFGFTIVIFSYRLGYYALSNISHGAFCETTESLFFETSIWPTIQLVLQVSMLLCVLVFASVLAVLSRKWQHVVELSTDDQATLNALDKLTTFELFSERIGKADAHSLRLLALAEKMQCR